MPSKFERVPMNISNSPSEGEPGEPEVGTISVVLEVNCKPAAGVDVPPVSCKLSAKSSPESFRTATEELLPYEPEVSTSWLVKFPCLSFGAVQVKPSKAGSPCFK